MSAGEDRSCDAWVYGDKMPDPTSRDLVGLKARWIASRLPDSRSPTVLDYGCGEGKFLRLVEHVCPQAILMGIDVVEPHGRVQFEFHRVGPHDPMPLTDETVDLVISCDVLEHVENIGFSLSEIARVLKPSGHFIGFVPMEGGFRPHSFFRLFDRDIFKDTKDHKVSYTLGRLRSLFRQDFDIVDLEYSYHFWGSALDASFFASFKLPVVGKKLEQYWRGQENVVYRPQARPDRVTPLGHLLKLANALAYCESNILRRVPVGAIGLLFHLRKRLKP